MHSPKILLFSLSLFSLREVSGSGCHGASRFRVEPAHTQEIASRSGSNLKPKEASALTATEQDEYCATEYGEGSRLFDLAHMEGEFGKPEDLQYALLGLFEEDPNAVFFVANDGDIRGPEGMSPSSPQQRLVLVLGDENSTSSEQPFHHRVAGSVFMETRDANLLDVQPLCNIPKPKYEGMNMRSSSSSSWGMSFLGAVTVAAVCVAALQTWRARTAATAYMTNPLTQPSLDLGGSYSVLLSSEENGLTQELAPSSN